MANHRRVFTQEETAFALDAMRHGSMSIRELRERLHCDDGTLRNLADSHGIVRAKKQNGARSKRRLFRDEEIAWLREAFDPNGPMKTPIQAACNALDCHYGTILRLFKRLGIPKPKVERKGIKLAGENRQSVKKGTKRPCAKCKKIFLSPDPVCITRCRECKSNENDSYCGCNAAYVGVSYGR